MHLNLLYNEHYGPREFKEGDCWVTSGTHTDILAPMGRYGCDPPKILIDTMLDQFNESYGKQDVIFLTGDLASHHTSMNVDDPGHTYPLLLETLRGISMLLAEKFPDTLILPAFGNNDSKWHDNPIPTAD